MEILVRSIFFSFFLSFIVILSADKLLLKHNVYDVYLQVKARYLLITTFEKIKYLFRLFVLWNGSRKSGLLSFTFVFSIFFSWNRLKFFPIQWTLYNFSDKIGELYTVITNKLRRTCYSVTLTNIMDKCEQDTRPEGCSDP